MAYAWARCPCHIHAVWGSTYRAWASCPCHVGAVWDSARATVVPVDVVLLRVDDADVDVLPAGGLVAVDGDNVLARLERLLGFLRDFEFFVIADEPRGLGREDA